MESERKLTEGLAKQLHAIRLKIAGLHSDSIALKLAIDAAIDAAVREEREAAIDSLKRFGPAHTYASENADHYRGFDAGVQRCIERLRSRCEVKE